jgi:hypothetical protein
MKALRRVIRAVALILAVGHLTMPVLTTTLTAAGSEEMRDLECTCNHGSEHGQCPMHHRSTDAARCRLQKAQGDLGLVWGSFMTAAVIPSPSAGLPTPSSSAADSLPSSIDLPAWSASPDPRPPRD